MPTRTASFTIILLVLLSVALTGCTSPLVGSWEGRGTLAEKGFEFSSMTFAPDGTYTATATYANTERAITGRWVTTNDTIKLDDGKREYRFRILNNNEIEFSDPSSGETITMRRLK